MRKIYLTVLTLAVAGGSAFSQSKRVTENVATVLKDRVAPRTELREDSPKFSRGGGAIWSDDFANPSTWVTGYDPTANSLEWEIGTNLGTGGGVQIDTIQSTTKDNGYAMIDSDEYGGESGGSEVEDSWFTTANPIDLSANPNVVLEFESYYYKWTYEECYVVISTNNTDWPELTPDTDISGMPNVFHVWPGMNTQDNVDNPTLKRINISAVAGGESTVWVRFHWTGTWGYAWFVDDVAILPQPLDDIQMMNAYVSHNGTGEEYGRIPQNQTIQNMLIGSQVFNFGVNNQNNLNWTADFTGGVAPFSGTADVSLLETDSTATLEDASVSGPLASGLYTGTYTVVSDNDTSTGPNFANNTLTRKFEVSDSIYGTDGIGVYDNPAIGSLGTNSFTDGEDGLIMFSYYDVNSTLVVKGIQVLLAPGTVAGGTIIVSVHDTADVLTTGDVTNVLEQSDPYDITQADIDAGSVTIYFTAPFDMENNAYFVSCEMFSNAGVNTIRILDDETVPQPFYLAMIYIPGDQVYSNGTAAAIRMIVDFVPAEGVGIADVGQLNGISIYPNPTEGIIRIDMDEQDTYRVEVMNVMGDLVHSSTVSSDTYLDLNRFGSGFYVVRVSTDEAAYTERIIVQ